MLHIVAIEELDQTNLEMIQVVSMVSLRWNETYRVEVVVVFLLVWSLRTLEIGYENAEGSFG